MALNAIAITYAYACIIEFEIFEMCIVGQFKSLEYRFNVSGTSDTDCDFMDIVYDLDYTTASVTHVRYEQTLVLCYDNISTIQSFGC